MTNTITKLADVSGPISVVAKTDWAEVWVEDEDRVVLEFSPAQARDFAKALLEAAGAVELNAQREVV